MSGLKKSFILRVENYKNGIFAKLPPHDNRDSVFILTEGIKDDLLVEEKTTSLDAWNGKYKKVVEISKIEHEYEYTFCTMSSDTPFKFEVYIKASIRVKNPVSYYQHRDIDVNEYIRNILFMDVNKITKKHSILAHSELDEVLIEELTSCEHVDENSGLVYQIKTLWTKPDEKAEVFLEERSKQSIEATIFEDVKKSASVYKDTYENAIWTMVARGQLLQVEAIEKIDDYRMQSAEKKMRMLKELREDDFITNKEAREQMKDIFKIGTGRRGTETFISQQNDYDRPNLDDFFDEEVNE